MNDTEHSERDSVVPSTDGFDLNEWVRKTKATDGIRRGRFQELERHAAQFSSDLLGVSGSIIDELIYRRPRLIPTDFWGGDLGWRSAKRQKRWKDLMTRNGIVASPFNSGLLIRCFFDPTEWVPHPYAPLHWTASDFGVFAARVAPSKEAFILCEQWAMENNHALTRRLVDRLRKFPVKIAASYSSIVDYADIAFLLPNSGTEMLRVKTVWKGESTLAELVKRNFPDTCREYSPQWLEGQRIDVFIPSLQVGLEYNGEQHYRPVNHFGGMEGYLRRKEQDQRKAMACKKAGVILIEWKYTEPVHQSTLQNKLEAGGIERRGSHWVRILHNDAA